MGVDNINDELSNSCRQAVKTSKACFRYAESQETFLSLRPSYLWNIAKDGKNGEKGKKEPPPLVYRCAGMKVLAFAKACNAMQCSLQFNNVIVPKRCDKVLRYVLRTPLALMEQFWLPGISTTVLSTFVEALATYTKMMCLVVSAIGEAAADPGALPTSRPCQIFLNVPDKQIEYRNDDVEISLMREGLSIVMDADADVFLGCTSCCIVLKLASRTLYGLDRQNRIPNLAVIRVNFTHTRSAYRPLPGIAYAMKVPRLLVSPRSDPTGCHLSLIEATQAPIRECWMKIDSLVKQNAELECAKKLLGEENLDLQNRISLQDRRNRKALKIAQHLDRYYNDLRVRSGNERLEQAGDVALQIDSLKESDRLRTQNKELSYRLQIEVENLRQRLDALDEMQTEAGSRGYALMSLETKLVESQYVRLEAKFDCLRDEIELERMQHHEWNTTLADQSFDTIQRLREHQSDHKKLQAERDQLQAGLLQLQHEKHDERARLTSEIDSLRLHIESSAASSGSGRRRRRGQHGPDGTHHSGSQSVLRQEERYTSVLSLASDKVAHGGRPNPSYERLPR